MLGATVNAKQYLAIVQREVGRLDHAAMEQLAQSIYQRCCTGRFVYLLTDDKNSANAVRFCESLHDITARFMQPLSRLRVLALTDKQSLREDCGIVEKLRVLGQPNDLVIAISGAGEIASVIRAVEWANEQGLETFAITGIGFSTLRDIAQKCLHVACQDLGVVEALQLVAFHYVVGRVYAMAAQQDDGLRFAA